MRISLELRGLATTLDGLQQVAEQFREVAEAREEAIGKNAGGGGLAQQINTHSAASNFNANALFGRSDTRSRKLPEGPRERLQRLAAEMRRDDLSPDRRGDLMGQAANARRTIERQEKGARGTSVMDRQEKGARGASVMDRLERVIGSSRLNLGGKGGSVGASPLVGQMAGLVGVTSGPLLAFTGGLAAGAMALKGLVDVTILASHNLQQMGQARSLTGGSSSDVLAFRQFGMDAGSGAAAAEAFRQRATSDIGARGARAQLGLSPVSASPYANVNSADVLNETLEALSQVTDRERQLSIARRLGLEGQLDELRVSPSVRAARKKHSEELLRMIPPQAEGQARDFAALIADIGNAWNDLGTVLGAEMLDEGLILATAIRDMLHASLPVVKQLGELITRPFELIVEEMVRKQAMDTYWNDKRRVAQDIWQRKNPMDVAQREGEKALKGYRAGKEIADDYLRAKREEESKRERAPRMSPDAWRDLHKQDFNNPLSSNYGGGSPKSGGKAPGLLSSAKPGFDPSNTAQYANTMALDRNTEAVNALRGEYGGGNATRNAVPSALMVSDPGDPQRKMLEFMAFRLGHFA